MNNVCEFPYAALTRQMYRHFIEAEKNDELRCSDKWRDVVRRHGRSTFLIFEDRRITYQEFDRLLEKNVDNLIGAGFQQGARVALIFGNCLEVLLLWFTFERMGCPVGFVHNEFSGRYLGRAVDELDPDVIVAEVPFAEVLQDRPNGEVLSDLRSEEQNVVLAGCSNPCYARMRRSEARRVASKDNDFIYLLTSGTSGGTKAARISHQRWCAMGDAWADLMKIDADDVFYCMLPICHGAATLTIVSTAITTGSSIVMKKKFSASQFWNDVDRYKITSCQYVGEICRYILNVQGDEVKASSSLIRLMGAGLDPKLWDEIQRKFGVEHIFEGWSQVETNAALMTINLDNHRGSCGHLNAENSKHIALVRYDVEHQKHLLSASGFLTRCEDNDVGEVIGRIPYDKEFPRYEGYLGSHDAIYENVFETGDRWWSTKDLLKVDSDGYLYFIDRNSDVHRWKGENISNKEVEEIIDAISSVSKSVVYGVKIADHDGKAGMAALTMKAGQNFFPEQFAVELRADLPEFAIPRFLRVMDEFPMTNSYKIKKKQLADWGIDEKKDGSLLFEYRDTEYRNLIPT